MQVYVNEACSVCGTKNFDTLPDTWNGRKVIDGTETDLRFLDPQGIVVGLVAKGKAKRDTSGFTILRRAS